MKFLYYQNKRLRCNNYGDKVKRCRQ